MRTVFLAVGLLVALVGGAAAPADVPPYRVVDLGTLGGAESTPEDMSDSGQVVGYAQGPVAGSVPGAFVWDGGPMTALRAPGYDYASAYAINDTGQVVGEAGWFLRGDWHACLWDLLDPGRIIDLGTLGCRSYARDINDSRQVVGWSSAPGGDHAFLWEWWGTRRMTDLGTLAGNWAQAFGINAKGLVIGRAWVTPGGWQHAVLWDTNLMTGPTDLGTLGGHHSHPTDINDSGQVVGWAQTRSATHAFLWEAGSMIDLGAPEHGNSYATDINECGQVVGWAQTYDGNEYPAIWQGGRMVDLGIPGANHSWDLKINDNGLVVGQFEREPGGGLEAALFLYDGGRVVDLGTTRLEGNVCINNEGLVAARGVMKHACLFIPGSAVSISGRVYEDKNGNGRCDAGEGIPGARVLARPSAKEGDDGLLETTTASGGQYRLFTEGGLCEVVACKDGHSIHQVEVDTSQTQTPDIPLGPVTVTVSPESYNPYGQGGSAVAKIAFDLPAADAALCTGVELVWEPSALPPVQYVQAPNSLTANLGPSARQRRYEWDGTVTAQLLAGQTVARRMVAPATGEDGFDLVLKHTFHERARAVLGTVRVKGGAF